MLLMGNGKLELAVTGVDWSGGIFHQMNYIGRLIGQFIFLPTFKDWLTAQNKLVRLQLNLPSRAHLNHDHFTSLGWLTVADRVQHLAMGLVFKIHNTTKIPMYLTDYFLKVKDRHNYNTRGSSTDHVQPRHGSNKGLNSFSCYATKMWNALPKVLKECKSLPSFKTALKSHLQATTSRNW